MDAEFEQEFNNPVPMHGVQENVAPTPAAVTWTDITDFQVYAPEGGTTLYANGKQQLKVRVSIRVKYKGFATVELDEQTLSTLTLVASGTGTPLVHDRFNPGDPIGWRYVLERNETFWTAPGTVDISSLCFEHRRKSMSTQRFTPEFKAEAVRQVIERGYSVADIAERLGVSTHSLYKWVKAVTPDKTEKQASELLEAKSEILRLRAQMRRLEEERDILKKAARYFAREPE